MPNNPGFLDTYSYVLYKNGKYQESEEIIQAALQQYQQEKMSTPWDVYKHLGMIKEKLGERMQAVDAYKQALQTGGEEISPKEKDQINDAIGRLR